MATFTEGGLLPEDDPIFSGSWAMFTIRKPAPAPELTPEEQKIIRVLEKDLGRKLSPQEVRLSLDQARHLGEL